MRTATQTYSFALLPVDRSKGQIWSVRTMDAAEKISGYFIGATVQTEKKSCPQESDANYRNGQDRLDQNSIIDNAIKFIDLNKIDFFSYQPS